jgi:hypothetical protein
MSTSRRSSRAWFCGPVAGYRRFVDEDDAAIQALIQAYVACRLAIDALPDLPDDLRRRVSDPVRAVCDTVGPALDQVRPGTLDPRGT